MKTYIGYFFIEAEDEEEAEEKLRGWDRSKIIDNLTLEEKEQLLFLKKLKRRKENERRKVYEKVSFLKF